MWKSLITLCMEIETRAPPALGNFCIIILLPAVVACIYLFIYFFKAVTNEFCSLCSCVSGKITPKPMGDKPKSVSDWEILDSPPYYLPTHGMEHECAAVWEYGRSHTGLPKDSEMFVRKLKRHIWVILTAQE